MSTNLLRKFIWFALGFYFVVFVVVSMLMLFRALAAGV